MVPSRLLIADVAVVRLLDDDRQQPSACPAASCRSCQEKQLLPLSRHQLQRGSCSHTQLTRPHHTLHCPNTIHTTSPKFWISPIFRLNRSLIIISISMFATLSTQYIMRIKLLLFSLMALFLSQTAAVKLSNGPRNKRNRHKFFLHVLPYVSQRHLCNIS